MTERAVGQVTHPVNSLADIRVAAETLDSILSHVGRLGVETLEGWDAAATSLVERNKVATYGATDDRMNDIDRAQYDAGRGPCVDALRGEPQYYDGEDFKPQWRQFADAAADVGVFSTVSFPFKLHEEVLGAINFYSRQRQALRSGQYEEGLVFAAHAAVLIANARDLSDKQTEIDQLSEGLQTRTIIGQATGLLMAQEGLSSEEAFHKLVEVSQKSNVKLREIAAAYVDSWEDKQPPTG